jgi:hypothetical protein
MARGSKVALHGIKIKHELARLARGSPQCAWIEDAPSSIIPLMLNDVTFISNE